MFGVFLKKLICFVIALFLLICFFDIMNSGCLHVPPFLESINNDKCFPVLYDKSQDERNY